MKKYIILFLFFANSLFAADFRLLSVDTNSPRSFIASRLIITNGVVITSTNCIPNMAIIGITNSVGAGDAGKIAKLNDSGIFDTSLVPNSTFTMALAEDRRANTVVGGTASSGAWTTHILTNYTVTASYMLMQTNTINLTNGTYRVEGGCSFYAIQYAKSRFRDISNGNTVAVGQSTSANAGGNGGGFSYFTGRFTVTGNANFQLQYFVNTSSGTSDLGQPISASEDELYGHVKIIQE